MHTTGQGLVIGGSGGDIYGGIEGLRAGMLLQEEYKGHRVMKPLVNGNETSEC